MQPSTFTCAVMAALLFIGANAQTDLFASNDPKQRMKAFKSTQGSAYSSAEGQNPGGPGDAVTFYDAESSSTSSYNGVYFKDGPKIVEAGDKAQGGWAGGISKGSAAIPAVAVASNFEPEYSFQRGPYTVAGTYEGARAVAGSGAMFGAADGAAITATIDAYAPTPQPNVMVGQRAGETTRSVAFTNIAPDSAAQSGIGNGAAAVASGWSVSSAARAGRDKTPPITMGHREAGDKTSKFDVLSKATKRHFLRHRRNLLLRGEHSRQQ